MNSQLSPEQFSSLKRTISEPAAKAAALVPVRSELIAVALGYLEKLIRQESGTFGEAKMIFKVDFGQDNGRIIDSQMIKGLICTQTLIVIVGRDGTMLGAASGEVTIPSASKESEAGPSITVLVSSSQLIVFAAGKPIAELHVNPPNMRQQNDWRRSWRELRQSFDDHFDHCINREQETFYWVNSKTRELLAGPKGTEKIFHLSLFWWCKKLITDALDVYGEAQSMGQDKTDITIVTEAGNIVVEVKWLGTNESGTSYTQTRIDGGLVQVAKYLKNNLKLMKGYLILYDARTEEEHKTESFHDPKYRHEKCEEPIIYFLQNETPSAYATRIVAEDRAKARKLATSK